MSFNKSNPSMVLLAAGVCSAAAFVLLITPLAAQTQPGNAPDPASPTTQASDEKHGDLHKGGYGEEILNNPARHDTDVTASPGTTHSESVDAPSVEPRHEPTAAEILRELSRRGDAPRPVILPVTPGQQRQVVVDSAAIPPNAVTTVIPKLFPDGYRIVDRPGRLAREGDYYTFSFETRTEGPVEIPVRLLPNRLLEDMEIVSAGGIKPVVFIISGEMTSYHGVNYLLVQKLLTRSYIGNLK